MREVGSGNWMTSNNFVHVTYINAYRSNGMTPYAYLYNIEWYTRLWPASYPSSPLSILMVFSMGGRVGNVNKTTSNNFVHAASVNASDRHKPSEHRHTCIELGLLSWLWHTGYPSNPLSILIILWVVSEVGSCHLMIPNNFVHAESFNAY